MVRVRLPMFAGAALLLAAQAAAAADLAVQPLPPPPVFGGWYLRGDIGFSNQKLRDITFVDVNGNTPDQQNLTKGFDSAGIFDLGVGYQFNSWFRVDVTGQYRGKSNFKAMNSVDQGGGNFAAESDCASKSEWLFLANAYADLGTWWGVTPFIGAGVGFSDIRISNFQDDTVGLNTNGLFVSHNYGTGADKWNFAWAVHAGLAYNVTPNFAVELAYHYVDLGDANSGPLFAGYDVVGQPEGSSHFHHITSHDLTLGVRWLFAAPPPPPMYPMVTKG